MQDKDNKRLLREESTDNKTSTQFERKVRTILKKENNQEEEWRKRKSTYH